MFSVLEQKVSPSLITAVQVTRMGSLYAILANIQSYEVVWHRTSEDERE